MTTPRRIFSTFSLRTLLVALAIIAMVLSVFVWRAEYRRKVFNELRKDGAIVRCDKSSWGTLFDQPVVAEFYVNVEGDQIRIGNQLFDIASAETFLLDQKSIANRHGLNNFQFYSMESVDTNPSEEIHSRILNFGVANFGNGGGFDRSMYEEEWEANLKLHEEQ